MNTPHKARLSLRRREARRWCIATTLALLLFMLWPRLDLLISGALLGPHDGPRYPWGQWAWVQALYQGVPVLGRSLLLLGLVLALLPRVARRSAALQRWHRRGIGLLLVVVLALGGAINAGLKEVWGRPRPVQVQELGGSVPFRTIAQPSRLCETNCSFVSGHAGTGFALMGVGLLAAPAARRRWWAIGMGTGALFGLGRVLQGGHFTSDIVFAGLVTWGVALLCRQGVLRWRAVRQRRRAAAASVRATSP